MREITRKLSILAIFTVIFGLLAACGGDGDTKEETTKSKKKKADVPVWFMAPPTAEDAIYAVGYAKKENMQLAMDTAKNRARDEISRVIGVKVSNMIKDFLEEAGVSGNSVSTEYTSSVSKSVSSNFLSGSKLEQQDLYEIDSDDDGNPNAYEAFALMKVSLKDMSSKIDEVMKNNAAAYAKLQANKGFDDLAKELKEINGGSEDLKPIVPATEE